MPASLSLRQGAFHHPFGVLAGPWWVACELHWCVLLALLVGLALPCLAGASQFARADFGGAQTRVPPLGLDRAVCHH